MNDQSEKIEEIRDRVKRLHQSLVEKKVLLLTVELSTEEEAEELVQWLYSVKKPMKSTLLSIAWDQVPVPKKVADAIEALKQALTA